jgi:hypothetical protein
VAAKSVTDEKQPYVPLQMNKEQRALFSAGMPVAAVHKLEPKRQYVNSVLDNGQRLLVIVGKERRLIKLL